jgi:hypothetical protein
MDIWQSENSLSFSSCLLGFISLKIWDLLVPSERRDFGKSIVEAIAFSAINFALLFWLVEYVSTPNLAQTARLRYVAANLALFFLFPAVWPVLVLWIMKRPLLAAHIVNPIQKPWDFVFSRREPAWVIVHLKNGGVIGGKFGSKSFASSYPAKEQIYVEELWRLDDQRNFINRIERTKGSIVLGEDILAVEFFE